MADFCWQGHLANHLTHELLVDNQRAWTGAEIAKEMTTLRERLCASRVVGILADNSSAWVIADIVCQDADIICLPLPAFFHSQQLRHALEQAGADTLLTDQPERIDKLMLGFSITGHWQGLSCMHRKIDAPGLPAGTGKISFTSGSTGAPKGVCLSTSGLLDTAHAVQERLADLPLLRHLAVLPMGLLLENVAGIYAPLLRGMAIHLPSLATLGWIGMQGFNPAALNHMIKATQASSIILVPELLKAWAGYLRATGEQSPEYLRFVAVGGASIAPQLLTSAHKVGIPAYQGYGLTEAGSVLALNRPGDDGLGVGRPLSHARLSIVDGQLQVNTRAFLGYMGQAVATSDEFATGDLTIVDKRGHLHLQGRCKNLLITSYGRNISPEWVEAALLAQPEIVQTIVVGDGQPALTAIVVPTPGIAEQALREAITCANKTLPGYAQIASFITSAPFSLANGLATGNGRPRRHAIIQHYLTALAGLQSSRNEPCPSTTN